MKISVETWTTKKTIRKKQKLKGTNRYIITKSVVLQNKKFIVARENGIISRKPFSTNSNKNTENMKQIFLESKKKFNEGKIKNFQNKFGEYKHTFKKRVLIKGTNKTKVEKITQIRHKYNFLVMGKNSGLMRTENIKVNRRTENFSFVLHAKFVLRMDEKVYVGWGNSNMFYCHDSKDFKDKKLPLAVESALAQFFAQNDIPFESGKSYDFKIVKSNINIYK